MVVVGAEVVVVEEEGWEEEEVDLFVVGSGSNELIPTSNKLIHHCPPPHGSLRRPAGIVRSPGAVVLGGAPICHARPARRRSHGVVSAAPLVLRVPLVAEPDQRCRARLQECGAAVTRPWWRKPPPPPSVVVVPRHVACGVERRAHLHDDAAACRKVGAPRRRRDRRRPTSLERAGRRRRAPSG